MKTGTEDKRRNHALSKGQFYTYHWVNPGCISQGVHYFCLMQFAFNFVINIMSYLGKTSFHCT